MGVAHTEETKAKISAANRGRKMGAEQKRKIAEQVRAYRSGARQPHGTVPRYKNQHCHCDECKRAWREYKRARKAARE